MNWKYTSSKFKYDNKPVERRKAILDTPLGELKVFEAVNGNAKMSYMYIGYENVGGKIIPRLNYATMPCSTLEEGVELLEKRWNELTTKMNNV
jgi:hypothetical protein